MQVPLDVAVYAEHSDAMKKVQPGWNTRVFNRVEVQEGGAIGLDKDSGAIRLASGVYRITGHSMVTYNDLDPHPSSPGWNTEPRPNGGYCRLRHTHDPVTALNERAIVVGSISNANMVPSIFETYLKVPFEATILVEHQVGDLVDGIYLQDNSINSSWHVFARIAIHRL